MSLLQAMRGASGRTRRRATVVVVAAGLVVGGTALVPTAGADEIGDKRAEAAKVADQLDALKSRQMDLSAQAERVEWERKQADDQVAEAQKLLDETNADLDVKREAVRDVAVQAYENGNDSPELDAFLTSDANSGLQKRSYLETRTGDMKETVDALSAARQKAEDDKARLEDAQEAAEAKSAEIQSLKDASDKAVADQQAISNKVQGELSTLVAEEQARRQAALDAAAKAAAAQPTPAPQSTGGTTGGTTAPRSGGGKTSNPVVVDNPAPPPAGSGAQGAINAAMSRIGVGDYVWGASGPIDFDCSGLVAWAYQQVGLNLPHYSGAQYNMTTRISRSQLQPGDLVFWGGGGSEHVAIYIGGNAIVHAFGSGGGVNVTQLDGWWKPATGYGRLNY